MVVQNCAGPIATTTSYLYALPKDFADSPCQAHVSTDIAEHSPASICAVTYLALCAPHGRSARHPTDFVQQILCNISLLHESEYNVSFYQ